MDPTVSSVTFLIIKVIALIGLAVYIVFAAIMVRQEQLMEQSLEESFQPILRIMTLIHLIAALAVFFFGVVLL